MKPSVSELLNTTDFAWSVISQKRQKTEDSEFNELTFYLQSPHNYFLYENEEFDILGWWKKHEIIYPVLSTMARDLLTVPVSTLAPDCAFIFNEHRDILNKIAFRLRGRCMLELYTCLRDWLHAKARTQGRRELDDDEISTSEFDDPESDVLALGECPCFVDICRCLNPNYTEISRKTLIDEAKKEYKILKPLLHSTFASLMHRISLACDVWHNKDWWQFIRVTAHWIDSDWLMHTRVLNFKLLDFEMGTTGGISKPIIKSIDSWGVKDKIFSITFDGDCDCPHETKVLKNAINPIFGGKLFHGTCVCVVFNTCIQEVFEIVGTHVQRIRLGIARIHVRLQSYYDVCEKYGMKPEVCMVDSQDDWDSTRRMLKSCMPYRDVLNEFIASGWPGDDSFTVNEHDWEIASVLCRVLDVFYEGVDCISRSYYPSSSGILLGLVNIAKLFAEYHGNFVFEEKFLVMEDIFLKHFDRIPMLYCMAAVMDPRIKLTGCESLMESFYQFTGNIDVTIDQEKSELHNLLCEMHSCYLEQSNMKLSLSPFLKTGDFAWSVVSQKRQKTEYSAFNELTSYLQSPHNYFLYENEEFDILGWWKKHEIIYPVLSTMARDLCFLCQLYLEIVLLIWMTTERD